MKEREGDEGGEFDEPEEAKKDFGTGEGGVWLVMGGLNTPFWMFCEMGIGTGCVLSLCATGGLEGGERAVIEGVGVICSSGSSLHLSATSFSLTAISMTPALMASGDGAGDLSCCKNLTTHCFKDSQASTRAVQ